MPDSRIALTEAPRRIGIAADHGGFEAKEYLSGMLREADYEVVDFGDSQQMPTTTIRISLCLARAVARGEVIAAWPLRQWRWRMHRANKVPGVRACLIHESFSAHQGVEGRRHERDLPGRPRGLEYVGLGVGGDIPPSKIQWCRTSLAASG